MVALAASASVNMALTLFLGARIMFQRQAGKTMAFTARQADIFAERPATVKA